MLKSILRKIIERKGYKIYKKTVFSDHVDAFEYNTPQKTNKFYNSRKNLENYFNKQRISAFNEILDKVKLETGGFSPLNILDAGCGCGYLTSLIKKRYPKSTVFGIDYSDEGIRIAKSKNEDIFFEIKNLNEKLNQSFDLIFCTSVLEHLKYPEDILNNLISHLNPGGKIIITVPNGRLDFFEGHIHFWSPESWLLFINKNIIIEKKSIYELTSKPDILTLLG